MMQYHQLMTIRVRLERTAPADTCREAGPRQELWKQMVEDAASGGTLWVGGLAQQATALLHCATPWVSDSGSSPRTSGHTHGLG